MGSYCSAFSLTDAETKAQIYSMQPKSSKKQCTGALQLCREVSRREEVSYLHPACARRWCNSPEVEELLLRPGHCLVWATKSPEMETEFMLEANGYH